MTWEYYKKNNDNKIGSNDMKMVKKYQNPSFN